MVWKGWMNLKDLFQYFQAGEYHKFYIIALIETRKKIRYLAETFIIAPVFGSVKGHFSRGCTSPITTSLCLIKKTPPWKRSRRPQQETFHIAVFHRSFSFSPCLSPFHTLLIKKHHLTLCKCKRSGGIHSLTSRVPDSHRLFSSAPFQQQYLIFPQQWQMFILCDFCAEISSQIVVSAELKLFLVSTDYFLMHITVYFAVRNVC